MSANKTIKKLSKKLEKLEAAREKVSKKLVKATASKASKDSKKVASKKAAPKKTTAKKVVSKKAATKKVVTKKTATKKVASKKAVAKAQNIGVDHGALNQVMIERRGRSPPPHGAYSTVHHNLADGKGHRRLNFLRYNTKQRCPDGWLDTLNITAEKLNCA